MKTHYYTIGSVRGNCGHKHHTPKSAAECCLKDSKGCKKQGGYSDRRIKGSDGTAWAYEELDGEITLVMEVGEYDQKVTSQTL